MYKDYSKGEELRGMCWEIYGAGAQVWAKDNLYCNESIYDLSNNTYAPRGARTNASTHGRKEGSVRHTTSFKVMSRGREGGGK